jgi:hypothetical protein
MSKRLATVGIVLLGLLLVLSVVLALPLAAEDEPGDQAPLAEPGTVGADVEAVPPPDLEPWLAQPRLTDAQSRDVLREARSGDLQRESGLLTQMPLYFIENQGQVDEPVAYYVQGQDKTLYFTPQGLTFVLDGGESPPWVLKLEFVGANPAVQPSGQEETGAQISYFKGRPDEWKTGLKTYSRVLYRDLWPGIDLEYSGTVNQLKYQFVVQPGADPGQIRLAYRGATAVHSDEAGRLQVSTHVGGFHDARPYAYQDIEGQRVDVDVGYALESDPCAGGQAYGFRIGAYDRSQPLVLDPVILVYCGYIGGSAADYGYAIAVDGEGNAYVTGSTQSIEPTFPVTVGPDLSYNGSVYDAFVAKVVSDGAALAYCGYIGGSNWEEGYGIAVDAAGNAYVTGWTDSISTTFPVIVGPDLSFGGLSDAFVAKVRADGTALDYCGYIGGAGGDVGNGIAVDDDGNAYIAGATNSSQGEGFPATIGPDLEHNGGYDAFVAKVASDGTSLAYCGYIGGNSTDQGYGIALDGAGSAYITGWTTSLSDTFPVMAGPDLIHNGGHDAFVAKVITDGTALAYCGYIGGSGMDEGYGIAVDAGGNAYVTGHTTSTESAGFPVAVGPDLTHNGETDAFVAAVKAGGTALDYCGYIGGNRDDEGYGIAVDALGNAYVTGSTASYHWTFPVAVGPDLTYNTGTDAFVAAVEAGGTALQYCGYIGGDSLDEGRGIALKGGGSAYVTGYTRSHPGGGFPVTVGPDPTYNGGVAEAFVAKVSPGPPKLEVSKTLLDPQGGLAVVSDTITFTIHITNTGPGTIAKLPLWDYYSPACLQFTSWSVDPTSVDPGLGMAHWADVLDPAVDGPGMLLPGETIVITVDYHALISDTMYWKEAGWLDYAPSGMPDFGQKQDGWDNPSGSGTGWFMCGPVAAANSLWWFDSKFEPNPVPPPTFNDGYPLVNFSGPFFGDDHDPRNVQPWVNGLAMLSGTTPASGTNVHDLASGIQYLINMRGLGGQYTVTEVPTPGFKWIVGEVRRSEDLILLLGFWQGSSMTSERIGGHYVTVAGVDLLNGRIAFSDPYLDRVEIFGLGRVLPYPHGDLHPSHPAISDTVHNDARYASHDMYQVGLSPWPGRGWRLAGYALDCEAISDFEGQNEGDFSNTASCVLVDPIYTEVEYAVAVSPITPTLLCKPTDNVVVVSGAETEYGFEVPEVQSHAQVKVNQKPELGMVIPLGGSGPAGVTTTFTTTWRDANGWADLKQCYFHIGDSPSIVGNVTLMYNAVKDKLWMRSDDGTAWFGGYAPGSVNTMENSQAIVHCDLTTVQGDGDTLSVKWAIEFKLGYEGSKKTGLKCKDRDKAKAKGQWKGTWTIY